MTQIRSFQRRSSQPISWHSTEETKPNTTIANNIRTKSSKLKQKNTPMLNPSILTEVSKTQTSGIYATGFFTGQMDFSLPINSVKHWSAKLDTHSYNSVSCSHSLKFHHVSSVPTCLLRRWKYCAGVVGNATWTLTSSPSTASSLLSQAYVIITIIIVIIIYIIIIKREH